MRSPADRLGQPGYVPRRGSGPSEAIEAIRAAGGLPVAGALPRGAGPDRRPARARRSAWAGLEVYYISFEPRPVERSAPWRASSGSRDRWHATTTATLGTYAEAHADLQVPPEVGRARTALGAGRRGMRLALP